MDLKPLKQANALKEITEETRAVLTEPYRPNLITLREEQWNALVRHTTTVGTEIVKNTDLIARLPNQTDMDELMTETVDRHLQWTREIVRDNIAETRSMMERKLTEITDSMTRTMKNMNSAMTEQMKLRDMTPWKVRLKWIAAGATLPSALLLWELLSKLW